jgi:energy-coupling factor transporter ATP-binding protein EcfA2
MGGCVSTTGETYSGAVNKDQNSVTNRQLQRLNRDLANRKTLLLLGTGESGKSTFFRQLKLVALKISMSRKEDFSFLQNFHSIFLASSQ